MTTSRIAGVDGFRRGWFAVLVNHAQGRVIETRHYVCGSFKEVLNPNPRTESHRHRHTHRPIVLDAVADFNIDIHAFSWYD